MMMRAVRLLMLLFSPSAASLVPCVRARPLGALAGTFVSGWAPNLSFAAHASSGAVAHTSSDFPLTMLAVFASLTVLSAALAAAPSDGSGGGGTTTPRSSAKPRIDRAFKPFDLSMLGRMPLFDAEAMQYIPAGAGFYTDDEVEEAEREGLACFPAWGSGFDDYDAESNWICLKEEDAPPGSKTH